jgi:hypothetical protein
MCVTGRLAALAVVAALISPTAASGQDYSFGDWARDQGYSPGDVMPETVMAFIPPWEPGPVPRIDSLDGIGEFDWTTTPTTQLWLHDNQISSIEPGDFDGLVNVWGLYLNRNRLSNIESGDFSGLANLTGLQLEGNQISSIEAGAFNELANLHWLWLYGNQISSIESGDFSGLASLTELSLGANQISSIESGDFSGLASLTVLSLGGNRISSIESGAFSGLASLTELGLSGNQISSVESTDVSGLASLTKLSLGATGYYYDAFVSKYDASGTFEWTRQLGTSSHDISQAVSADGLGNVYISGVTEGGLEGNNAGDGDAFISKYDASGALQWTRQLGTSSDDYSHGVSADGLGNVYISGETKGDLEGTNAGGSDAFISRYDASGTFEWTRQLGTNRLDYSSGVSVDELGNVYISGGTKGDLEGTNAGGTDAFVAKFMDFSEPLLGDINDDGEINGLDVDPFVDVLLASRFDVAADMNGDGVVNGLDVAPFVAAVVGGDSHHIPEPSTLLLAAIALLGLLYWQRTGIA